MSTTPVTILIVDDHPLLREGLTARIEAQPDLSVCGVAGTPDEAFALAQSVAPDVIVVDLSLGEYSGFDLIDRLRSASYRGALLVVSAYEEALFAERALRAGALGYVNKQELQGSVVDAIRTVHRGDVYLSARMQQHLLLQHAAKGDDARAEGMGSLSDRELQIFRLIGQGVRTRAIADQLHLSVHTVDTHREKIRAKLGIEDGVTLMREAVLCVLRTGF